MSTSGKNYYGGFFWVAVVSFIVPVFVAFKGLGLVRPTTKPTPTPDVSGVDHNLWDYLLRTYVENGLVDYEGLERDYLFQTYLKQIASCQPEALETDEEKLALHCNAYNALVIHGVINHKIHREEKNVLAFVPAPIAAEIAELESKIEKLGSSSDPQDSEKLQNQIKKLEAAASFFGLEEHIFANQTISLDQLEHEIIRPIFKEPRVHVALVCAAKSCPAIRPEAYVGKRLGQQLQDQAKLFANDTRYVLYDSSNNRVQLSPILNWYGVDWERTGGYLAWLEELVQDKTLKEKLAAADAGSVVVEFNSYDWTLNSTASSTHSGSAKGGGFGSGSVPNE